MASYEDRELNRWLLGWRNGRRRGLKSPRQFDVGVRLPLPVFINMKIQVLSDLHLEHHADGGREFIKNEIGCGDPDVTILAGDLCTMDQLAYVLTLICKTYPNVHFVYVPGNHELYGTTRGCVQRKLRGVELALRGNLTCLQNQRKVVKAQAFVGSTLWFPTDPMNVLYEHAYNDFKAIPYFRGWVEEENRKAKRFLEAEVHAGDVVVTHFAPSVRSVGDRFRGSQLNRFYVTPLDELLETRKAVLWVHGHMHSSADYKTTSQTTRVVCNPLGYPFELNPSFNAGKILWV